MTRLKKFTARAQRFAGSDRGAAAVEMSLVLPVLAFAFLGMVDVSMAINNRMHLDTALRTAAEAALTDPGTDQIKKVFAATEQSEPTSSEIKFAKSVDFTLNVDRYCTCPGSTTKASCTNVCTGGAIPYLYYELNGDASYSGIFLSAIPFSRTISVQLR